MSTPYVYSGGSGVYISAWRLAVFSFSSVLPAICRCSFLNYYTTTSFYILSSSLYINHAVILV
jgi:hypothetical protein